MSNPYGQQPPGGYPPPGPGAQGSGGYGPPGAGAQGQGTQGPGTQPPGGYPPPGSGPPGYGPGSYAPPARPRSKVRWLAWYGIGVLLLVAGVVSIVLGVSSFSGAVHSLARVPLPAGRTVTLSHQGSNVIYYESAAGAPAAQSSISIRIVPASAGAQVADLRTYGSGSGSSSSWTLNGRHGVAIFTVQVVHPGRFTVAAASPGGALNGGSLAIGGSVAGHLLVGLLVGILLILAGLAVLVVTTIVLVIRRVRGRPSPQPGYPQPGQA